MPVIRLADVQDTRVAPYRDIPDPELLRARGLFIAEGRLVVRRLLDPPQPRFRIRSLLLNDASFTAMRDLLAPIEADVDMLIASAADITAIGQFDFHRGCLALVERPAPMTIAELRLDVADGDAPIVVVLEGIGNADNVGGIFRNAAAFGARAVIVGPRCCDPLYRKATRTSMGATLIVPFAAAAAPDWPAALAALRAADYRLVALTPHPPAMDLAAFAAHRRATDRLALLVGAEGSGLTEETLAAATDRVAIAMSGRVDSLNVATAAGIALHRLARLG